MATIETITEALKLVEEKKINLKKAFEELQSHSSSLSSFTLTWADIDSHFSTLHSTVLDKFNLIKSQPSIPKTQIESVPLVEKRNEKSGIESGPLVEKKKEKDGIESGPLVEKKKEKGGIESGPLIEKKKEKGGIESGPLIEKKKEKGGIESGPLIEKKKEKGGIESGPLIEKKKKKGGIESGPLVEKEKDGEKVEVVKVKARPELIKFCKAMDGRGMRDYIIKKKPKERLAIGNELQDAFKYASNAAEMVLDGLDGFFVSNYKGDKDTQLTTLRKACITMLEGLMESKVEVSPEVRERAKSLALDWKERVSVDGSSTFESYGFLYLVVNYGLVDLFSMDDLIDMSVMSTNFAQSIRLCRVLCLGDKTSDLIQKIISKGKKLQAVKYILEFKLADKFPPVPLLKEYVDEAKKNAQKVRKDGKNSLQSLNEATTKEVNAMTSVVDIIKNYKLEAEPFKQTLTKQIEVLEKEKANRKKHPQPPFGPKFRPQNNLSGTKRPRDTTLVLIPNNVTFTSSANNPPIHQAAVSHVSATNPVAYNAQSYNYNASSSAQSHQKSYSQFVPGGDMRVPNGATTTTTLNVPPYQQSYVQHTPTGQVTIPNVGITSEAVSAYQQSYQPRGSYGSEAAPHGLAGSAANALYASSSAGGLYGSAEASLGIIGNSTHTQAHVYATEPNTASGYYDRSENYGGYVMPAPQYHQTYHPQ